MPIATIATDMDRLESLTVEQLKNRIRTLNSSGHSISLSGRKARLVTRVYYAENPHIKPTPPTVPNDTLTQIDTTTALARTAEVHDENSKAYAATIISDLVALKNSIEAIFDQNTENWNIQISAAKKGKRDAIAMVSNITDPIDESIRYIKSRISQYELQLNVEKQEQKRKLLVSATLATQDRTYERVLELYDEGRIDEAEKLEQSMIDGSIDRAIASSVEKSFKSKPVKVKGVSTRLVWKWTLTDVNRLKPAFTKTVANYKKIDKVVFSSGEGAYELVGPGAIEVKQEAITRSTGR